MTDQADVNAQLLAHLLEQDERRRRRNRVLVWVAIAVVLLGALVALVVKHQRDEARDQRIVNQMYCDMTTDYGTERYYDCIDGG